MVENHPIIQSGANCHLKRSTIELAIMQKVLSHALLPPCVDRKDGGKRIAKLLLERPDIVAVWDELVRQVLNELCHAQENKYNPSKEPEKSSAVAGGHHFRPAMGKDGGFEPFFRSFKKEASLSCRYQWMPQNRAAAAH